MAVEKLSDGIRKFAADAVKLEHMIKVQLRYLSLDTDLSTNVFQSVPVIQCCHLPFVVPPWLLINIRP